MSAISMEIADLRVAFPSLNGSLPVLRGVNIMVEAGEVLGLVGESGSGKSMTALACLGMVPAPARVDGSIRIAGEEIVGRTGAELAGLRGGTVAMVFQNPMRSLNPFFTVGQQMLAVLKRHHACSPAEARAIALAELAAVQLPDPAVLLDRYPHQLSGGQLQRVMIALAIACHPKLIIADEPTTALDVTVQAQIVFLLRSLADQAGLTVLFITHDLAIVSQLCDRVAVMYAGEVVETGPVTDIIDQPQHPYTEKLLATVPVLGRGKQPLAAIRGQVPLLGQLAPGCSFCDRCDRATGLCASSAPRLRRIGPRREVACHYAGGSVDA